MNIVTLPSEKRIYILKMYSSIFGVFSDRELALAAGNKLAYDEPMETDDEGMVVSHFRVDTWRLNDVSNECENTEYFTLEWYDEDYDETKKRQA